MDHGRTELIPLIGGSESACISCDYLLLITCTSYDKTLKYLTFSFNQGSYKSCVVVQSIPCCTQVLMRINPELQFRGRGLIVEAETEDGVSELTE